MDERVREYVDALAGARWQAAEARQSARLTAALPAKALERLWGELERALGAFEAIESSAAAPQRDGSGVVLVTLRFAGGRADLRIAIDTEGRVAGLFRGPDPGDATAYAVPAYVTRDAFEERSVEVGSAPALPGTLSLPKGAGPFRAVVLVHGSGPSDRNGSVGGNRPLQDLAWGLATRGIAALRYEKRTRVAPMGVVTSKEEVIDAVRAAVTLLAETPSIDSGRIVVVGHSQGGYLAPRIAHEVPGIAAIAVLAGPTRPLEDCLVDQLDYITTLGGPAKGQVEALAQAARAFRERARDPSLGPDDVVVVPPGASLRGAYFLDLRGYAPAECAARLGKPCFVAHAGRDYQVDDTDLRGWRATLPASAIHVYPTLDHLLRSGEGKATPASYSTAGHVAEEVVRDLAAWVSALA